MPHRPLEPGARFSLRLTADHGAALKTRYKTYVEDARADRTFKNYVKRHHKSWVAFAADNGYEADPVLVSGFDMTSDYAMLAYSNEGFSLEAGSQIGVPMVTTISGSMTVQHHTMCSPHVKYGPALLEFPPVGQAIDFPSSQSTDPRATPNGFNQCVFIRYYTMRWRKRLFPKVIRAGAGPQDLGSGDNKGCTFPELSVQSGDEPTASSDDNFGEESDLTRDDDGSELVVARNAPDVWFLRVLLFLL